MLRDMEARWNVNRRITRARRLGSSTGQYGRREWAIQTAQLALVKGEDFDPVCALSCRIASDQLQRAGLGVDHVGRDRVRQFAGDDHEAAAWVDIESARLLLGRRASEIGERSAR